jgi:hypothetical protein
LEFALTVARARGAGTFAVLRHSDERRRRERERQQEGGMVGFHLFFPFRLVGCYE